MKYTILMLALLITCNVVADDKVIVNSLLDEYQNKSKIKFSAKTGFDLWRKKITFTKTGNIRSCTTCHTSDLSVKGKHIKTKKIIEPLAPSVNAKRLTKIKTIKKWLKRNCKWTLGRECTAEEKGHLLKFIQSQ